MMDAKLKIAMTALRNITKVPRAEFDMTTVAKIAQTAFCDIDAISPPVAAGSVDTLQRHELVETQHGTGYMVHWDKAMEEDADGEWVKHVDAVVWGAQQREAGKMEAIATLMPRINHHSERAEKAEAEVKQVNEWRNAALQENMRLADVWMDRVTRSEARVKELEERIEELETEIKVPHLG